MNICVLGNAGYIGNILTDTLLSVGHRVTGIDWGVFGFHPLKRAFTQIRGDTRDLDESNFEGIDAVIDLAAISNDPAGDLNPKITWEVNAEARRKNAVLAAHAGVKRYILASTCSVYGASSGSVVDEKSPVRPVTEYAKAAVAAEQAVLQQNDPMIVTVLRQGTVYGYSPRMRWDIVVNAFVRDLYTKGRITVHGTGGQWRPHLYVHDTAKVMTHLLEIEPAKIAGKTFNVIGQNMTIRELAEDLVEHFGGEIEFREGEPDPRSYRVEGNSLKWTLLKYPGCHILEATEILWDKLESGEVDPNLPNTVDVYKKYFATEATA